MFKNSVLKSISQDESLIAKRWANFQEFKAKIEFLRSVKEEKYQEGFLKDVFEACLGYTLDSTNPNAFNLERERKNETDGKKADGAIHLNGEIVGIIELKAQDTKNLDKATDQAFGYLVSNSKAHYVIVSNFDELRFYIDKKTAFEKFSLFNLTYEEFKKLHLVLSFESIQADLPLKLKEKSANFEAEISKQLYRDFSAFRTHLFENIIKNNSTIPKSTLLRLTQKLCDRIIFILFAEDRGLLKDNTIKEIREEFRNQKFTHYSLYDMYKFYFDGINNGNERLSIPKYNGGLFSKDELLDALVIDDVCLDLQAQKLSDYDFVSDVSVNILGHIFEQSLTDLEELQANINNTNFDKTKSKRKKDGVFYTPQYITNYIVQNTLGKLCEEKKKELFGSGTLVPPTNPKKLTKQEKQTLQNIYLYREYLLNLKILDPACGSGAFLNQALEFLIQEHKELDDMRKLYENELLSLYDIETNILERNLYGVDINEDAVEIARLSLWLRTAQRGRTLIDLNDKIVCANSLLNMPFVVGSEALASQKENVGLKSHFQIDGGFDVVIGNPPYVRVQGLKSNYEDEAKLYEEKFASATGKYDIYALFIEMSFNMLKNNGKLSFILPHKFLISDFGSGIRGFLSKNRAVESLLHFGSEMVFEDASTYTCIITLSHNNQKLNFKSISPKEIFNPFEYDLISYENLNSDKWNLSSNDIAKILDKINQQPLKVKDIFKGVFQGTVTVNDDIFMLRGKIVNNHFVGFSNALNSNIKLESNIVKPILKGQDIKRYAELETNLYIVYPHYKESNKTVPYEENYLKDFFPLTYDYLLGFKDLLIEKKIKYKTNPKYWYSLHRAREIEIFENEKLITPNISMYCHFTIGKNNMYSNVNTYMLVKNNQELDYKYLISVFNRATFKFHPNQSNQTSPIINEQTK